MCKCPKKCLDLFGIWRNSYLRPFSISHTNKKLLKIGKFLIKGFKISWFMHINTCIAFIIICLRTTNLRFSSAFHSFSTTQRWYMNFFFGYCNTKFNALRWRWGWFRLCIFINISPSSCNIFFLRGYYRFIRWNRRRNSTNRCCYFFSKILTCIFIWTSIGGYMECDFSSLCCRKYFGSRRGRKTYSRCYLYNLSLIWPFVSTSLKI